MPIKLKDKPDNKDLRNNSSKKCTLLRSSWIDFEKFAIDYKELKQNVSNDRQQVAKQANIQECNYAI